MAKDLDRKSPPQSIDAEMALLGAMLIEKDAIIKARIGQGNFRKLLISKYDGKCIVTGLSDIRMLVASHIKPWAISSNEDRLDVENGFLLNCLYDKMFDLGLISFKNDGTMLISTSMKKCDIEILQLQNVKTCDLKSSKKLLTNLEYHRDVIFLQ